MKQYVPTVVGILVFMVLAVVFAFTPRSRKVCFACRGRGKVYGSGFPCLYCDGTGKIT